MDTAVRLSLRAHGQTSPNPIVGAVIAKNGTIIASSFHKKAGAAHAEAAAIKKAGAHAKNSTLYVTLEPCSTYGRTPPCTEAIIRSGIKKVVIGMVDPNPAHRGRGISILRKHKIRVQCGVLRAAIRATNQAFVKYITKQKPYLTVKVAQSIDGKIATAGGDSQWITSPAARRYAHRLRNHYDAIMVGLRTVAADNPLLNPLGVPRGKKFYKIIVDTSLAIPTALRIFKDSLRFPVIIAASKDAIARRRKKVASLTQKGAVVLGVETKGLHLDLSDLMRTLAELEITNIVVEGGGRLIGSLFDEKLVDYALFFIRPGIIGGSEAISSIQGKGISRVAAIRTLSDIRLQRIGGDLLVEGALHRY